MVQRDLLNKRQVKLIQVMAETKKGIMGKRGSVFLRLGQP